MTFSVPRSKADPGRAPDLASRIHTPQLGTAIAKFGTDVMAGGQQIERLQKQKEAAEAAIVAENDKSELDRAKVDFQRDLNNLRLQVMEIGDPKAMEAAWMQGVNALRAQYGGALSEANQEAFGLAFDRSANTMTFDVGKDALKQRQSQALGNWAELSHEITRTSANGDYETRLAAVENGQEVIDGMVARGVYTPEEGAKLKLQIASDAANAQAMQMLKDDPQGLITALDEGQFTAFDGEAEARYRVQANTAIATAAEQAATKAARDAKEREKVMTGQIDTAIDIMGKGATPDLGFMSSPDFASNPNKAKLEFLLKVEEEKGPLAHLGRDEILTMIETEKQKPLSEAYQTAHLEALQDVLKVVEAGRADPIAQAETLGIETELPEFSSETQAEYFQAVEARAATGEHMVETDRADTFQVFRKDELPELKEKFGPGGDPDDRLGWVMTMDAALQDKGPQVVLETTGDQATAYAAHILRADAPPETVRDIFSGQRRIKDGMVTLPSRDEFLKSFSAATHGEFRDSLNHAPQVFDAAIALYAEAGGDPDEIDTELFTSSVHRALGGEVDRNGKATVGGLQVFDTRGTNPLFAGARDDYHVVLEPTVRKQDVDAAIDTIIGDLSSTWQSDHEDRRTGKSFEGHYTDPDLSQLTSISMSGQPPNLGDPEADDYEPAELFSSYRLENLLDRNGNPTGVYTFYRPAGVNGGRLYLEDTNGETFLFKMSDFIGVSR